MGASLSSITNTYVDWNRNPTRIIQFQENTTNGSGCGPVPSSFKGFEYDVFLSFRGEDTRYKFTSHLHSQLKDAGVQVYMDERRLRGGEDILPSLLEAIQKSRISIPIFSPDYASSKSCLREVATMNECRDTIGQIVLPIFYEIEPSDVRKQTGPFMKPFYNHRRNGVGTTDLDRWKKALDEIGFLKGYHLGPKVDEAELVKKIVSVVLDKLPIREVPVIGKLVGMEQRVEAVVEKLRISSDGVRVVGICGMAGIGKTTLAKSVYNKLHVGFEGCSFISNIRENNILSLQTQLISDLSRQKSEKRDSCEANKRIICNGFTLKKVLIVLDDVDNWNHLEAFGVSFQSFGPGSRIVLTTRNEELLSCREVADSYQVDGLNELHARQLFHWRAFHKDSPEEGYDFLSDEIASKIGGNPSFIRSVGDRLHNCRDKKEWNEVLKLLRNCDDALMRKWLKTSYGGLTDQQKQIYLDIACFLRGVSNTIASYMWEDCEFSPITTRKKLVGMSLLTIGENDEMQMDYPVGEYGRIIVSGADVNPEMRSRLWIHEDALEVLQGNKGSDKIEAMCLQFDSGLETSPGFGEIPDPLPLMAEHFTNLKELRFLRLDRAKIRGNFEKILPKLRWLDWKDCTEISEEVQNLDLEKLVILDMSRSNVTHVWSCWNSIGEKATNLKVLQLAECNHLHESPSFPDCRKLERLNFEGCSLLRSIRIPSETVRTLVFLNIKGCRNITELPKDLSSMVALETLIIDDTPVTKISFGRDMENLKHVSACGCKNLKIDDSIGELKSLSHLALDHTGTEILPSSIGSLSRLQTLSLRNCKKVMKLPRAIGKLTSLVKMDFSYTLVEKLPREVKDLKSLQDLVMAGTFLSKFPGHIAELKGMKNIDFSYCRSMEGRIPDGIANLSSLKTLKLSATKISSFPADMSGLSQLQVLEICKCKELQELPILPTSVTVRRNGPHT